MSHAHAELLKSHAELLKKTSRHHAPANRQTRVAHLGGATHATMTANAAKKMASKEDSGTWRIMHGASVGACRAFTLEGKPRDLGNLTMHQFHAGLSNTLLMGHTAVSDCCRSSSCRGKIWRSLMSPVCVRDV